LRAGFARTIFAARQAVAHGHVVVNGRCCTVRSRVLRPGSIVALKPSSRNIAVYTQGLADTRPPAYLSVTPEDQSVRVVAFPVREQIPVLCEAALVVQYYSG